MGYLLSFRFHPAGEEIINLLNEKGLDPDFSVQTIYKVDEYYFDPLTIILKNCDNYRVTIWHLILEIMLQKIFFQGKNCDNYRVTIWHLILEIMLQKIFFQGTELQLFLRTLVA
ncbi:uncharacterized protein LOC112100394 isoform X3 [Citrus clementina]|uniref:uncharacterized protein LOC112100394 isoform X3 n=1 Tax=Citrus clementina TaxID=85681 RepID=UPI000CECE987|nr:uncharacterized protein LOC112100394 isoform X3 [Citrus x clementina]